MDNAGSQVINVIENKILSVYINMAKNALILFNNFKHLKFFVIFAFLIFYVF